LGQHGILVNAVIPGATMTAERIAAMQSSAMKGPFEAAPADAPQTLAKQRELLQQGGLSERLGNMPLGRTGYPDDLAKGRAVHGFRSGQLRQRNLAETGRCSDPTLRRRHQNELPARIGAKIKNYAA
jgi:NAD(P)-dependent dehydrogenase (short-subunit alcohol dehydrogenase family)